MGNKNARITIVEYSDFICPFCKRHYTAQTLEKIVEKYPNDVNMVFRQMPLVQLHPTAPL
jgi:protein-disulfide isomerase